MKAGMTLQVLEKKVLDLSPRARVRLGEKIVDSIDDFADATLAAVWDEEIGSRLKDIEAGVEKGIPAAQVMQATRPALNEARRLPSARRQ